MTGAENGSGYERQDRRRRLAHLQIEADHVRRTGSDDFDVPEIANQVRALAGLKPITRKTGMAAAEEALRDQGFDGDRLADRLAEIRKILRWDEP